MNKILRNLKLAKKLLIGPVAVSLFLLLLAGGTYHGMNSQKEALDDIYNNRFQGYQNSSEISRTIANVHANLYKVVSWAGANYEAAKVDALGKEQKTSIEKSIAFVQNLQKSAQITPEEKKSTTPPWCAQGVSGACPGPARHRRGGRERGRPVHDGDR
jgi:hypothetical protein